MTLIWSLLLGLALLWPGRLAGPLDGIPLDQPIEVLALVLIAWAVCRDVSVVTRRDTRVVIVVLLAWKVITGVTATQDGWCLRFTAGEALYLDQLTVPHSWDIRADWRSPVPRCSAVMTHDYAELENFPVWFFNLPPAEPGDVVVTQFRPPQARTRFDVSGVVRLTRAGRLRLVAGEHVPIAGRIGDRSVSTAELAAGVPLEAGIYDVGLSAVLTHTHWSLAADIDGDSIWPRGAAMMTRPSSVDTWLRPWGGSVSPILILALLMVIARDLFENVPERRWLFATIALALVMAAAARFLPEGAVRLAPLLLLVPAIMRPPRRLRTMSGALLLVGLPWIALWMPRAAAQAGLFTWYSAGDDWWMFQRFAYRIYMQGHWLEGGEPTFWFQPFYRWVAGALHLVFGDSSVGELLWDIAAALVGAMFAFTIVKVIAGYRWAIAAAVLVLAVFTFGPAWHLIGRGMSEYSSMGFLYLAALLAIRARRGDRGAAIAAGICAILAGFTRLNNMPIALATVLFAWPLRLQAGSWPNLPKLWRTMSRPAAAGVLSMFAIGLWLFAARTYHYTGVLSLLHGTTAQFNSVWNGEPGIAAVQRVGSSLAMLVTMNDPPRFDVRAIPVIAGVAFSLLALVGVPRLRRLPLNATLFCLAGLAGGLVARGVAYPGRFSIHLIPAAVAVTCCGAALLASRRAS